MQTFIALKLKKEFGFLCASKNEEEFSAKVNRAYGNWRGMQSRAAAPDTKTKEAFLSNYSKVKITLETIF